MKVYLMYPDRDFDPTRKFPPQAETTQRPRRHQRPKKFNLSRDLPSTESAVVQDLELETLFKTMAQEDDFLYDIVVPAVLSSLETPNIIPLPPADTQRLPEPSRNHQADVPNSDPVFGVEAHVLVADLERHIESGCQSEQRPGFIGGGSRFAQNAKTNCR